jgi:hypothetical protein
MTWKHISECLPEIKNLNKTNNLDRMDEMDNTQTQLDDLNDDMAFQTRLNALKKAAIVMGGVADSFKDDELKSETKSLAWAISWAVIELAKTRGAA